MNKSKFLISSALCFGCIVSTDAAKAQIIPDRTLPVNSRTNTQGNTVEITGGTEAGANLFHSFEQFSVPTGTAAFFNNAPNIENILTRVTGGQISNIDGLIKANGFANLFLLNPNGIAFGPNARLDIGGSFLASTATGLTFADGNQFLAVNPEGQPLLTVSVPLGLQMPGVPKSIINQNAGLQVPDGRTLALVGGNLDLAGGNLTATQGQIELGSAVNGQVGINSTPSGLALGYEGVGGFGNIQLSEGASVDTSGPGGGSVRVAGGRVALTEGSNIVADTFGNIDGRGIEIQANQLSIDGGAFISSSTFGDGNAGNLTVRATESVQLTGNGNIGDLLDKISKQQLEVSDLTNALFSVSFPGSGGGSGNLNIETGRLVASQGAVASTANFGEGLGGNLNVVTTPTGSVELSDAGLTSGTASSQRSGDITINTGRLLIEDGGVVATTTISGTGAGGNLIVTADLVELTGVSAKEFALFDQFTFLDPSFSELGPASSGLFTLSLLGAGPAGDVEINTGRLLVEDGAIVSTIAIGGASSGNVIVRAREFVELTGTGKLQIIEEILTNNVGTQDFSSGIFSSSFRGGTAGDVTVETGRLTVRDGAVVSTSTFGDNPGGNLNIEAANGSVELIGGALLTGTTGVENAGDLIVNTGKLTIEEGGLVATSSVTSQQQQAASGGRGGDVIVNAESIELIGLSQDKFDLPEVFVEGQLTPSGQIERVELGPQPIPSSILTLTFSGGDAGNLEINAGELSISDGAAISTSTGGLGRSGDLTIRAARGITLVGQGPVETPLIEVFAGRYDFSDVRNGLFASSFGEGQAGNLTIDTPRLTANNGAFISASNFFPLGTSLGSSDSGNLTLNAPGGVIEINNSAIFTGTAGSLPGGNIKVNAGNLILRSGSSLATSTVSPGLGGLPVGRGGNLTVNARSVELSGRSLAGTANNLSTLTFGPGNAGNLRIDTETFIARDGGLAFASTFGTGSSGDLIVNASESVELSGGIPDGGLSPGQFPSGFRADAPLEVPSFGEVLPIEPGEERGTPGNLEVTTNNLVVRDGAEIVANAGKTADAGDITINTNVLSILDGGRVTSQSPGIGNAGNINVTARELVEVRGFRLVPDSEAESGSQLQQSTLAATGLRDGTGNSGSITITTPRLVTAGGADISVSAFGQGASGNLRVTASESVELLGAGVNPNDPTDFSRSGLFAATEGTQDGGSINIDTGRLTVRDGARISASTRGPSPEGPQAGQKGGRGGDITINAGAIELSGSFASPESVFPSGIFALSGEVRPARFNLPPEEASGDGGNITITNAQNLTIRDGAQISAEAQGLGTAGNIDITATNIRLNEGSIATATNTGDGGNITLTVPEFLIIENNSRIVANAVGQGNGGNINIEAQGLFRANSIIDASSQFGLSGNVDINQPDVATAQELIDVTEQVINPEEQISLSCIGDREEKSSEITITGRGGLPPGPSDPLSSQALVDVDTTAERPKADRDSKELPPPATGWYVDSEGNVILTSRSGNAIPENSPFTSPNCRHVQ